MVPCTNWPCTNYLVNEGLRLELIKFYSLWGCPRVELSQDSQLTGSGWLTVCLYGLTASIMMLMMSSTYFLFGTPDWKSSELKSWPASSASYISIAITWLDQGSCNFTCLFPQTPAPNLLLSKKNGIRHGGHIEKSIYGHNFEIGAVTCVLWWAQPVCSSQNCRIWPLQFDHTEKWN